MKTDIVIPETQGCKLAVMADCPGNYGDPDEFMGENWKNSVEIYPIHGWRFVEGNRDCPNTLEPVTASLRADGLTMAVVLPSGEVTPLDNADHYEHSYPSVAEWAVDAKVLSINDWEAYLRARAEQAAAAAE